MRRGQTALEFMLIMSIALLILLMTVTLSNDQGGAINTRKTELSASLAASDIANAAREVYGQGSGARKLVLVAFPRSYNASLSAISSPYIRIHVGRTDYVQTFPFQVVGTLPSRPGTFEFSVINQAGVINVSVSENVSASPTPSAAPSSTPSSTPTPSASPAPYAMLSGRVVDAYGIGVSGATVNLTNSSTLQYNTTNSSGYYSLNVSLGGQSNAFIANASSGVAYNYSAATVSLSAGVPASANFTISSFSPIEFIVFLQNSTGGNVAAFSPTGDVVLWGNCTAAANCSSLPAGALAFRDSLGVAHAYITEAGNLCLEDANCSDYDASCIASDNLFVVKNSSNVTVSYISEAGQLCMVGGFVQNGNP